MIDDDFPANSSALEELAAHVTDNGEPNPGGRPSEIGQDNREKGQALHNKLASELHTTGLRRPKNAGWTRNPYGRLRSLTVRILG